MKKKHISTSGSKSLIFYHFVFVTKYRRKVLNSDMIQEITGIAIRTCEELGGIFQEGNGEDDHYHLLVQLPPTIAPGKFVKRVKGASSRILRDKYWDIIKKKLWGDHLWSPSYYCSSTGGVTLETVRRYVQQQGQDNDDD